MRRLLPHILSLILLLIFTAPVPVHAQSPKLVHSRSLSTTGEPGNNFKIIYGGSMGTGTLAGNLRTLRVTYPHGSTVSSSADNRSFACSLGVSEDNGSGVTS